MVTRVTEGQGKAGNTVVLQIPGTSKEVLKMLLLPLFHALPALAVSLKAAVAVRDCFGVPAWVCYGRLRLCRKGDDCDIPPNLVTMAGTSLAHCASQFPG